jgi:carbon-monoxide dehydrogenase medium subunit
LAAVLYKAIIVARSLAGERRIPADGFFHDAYVTALQPGEMVTSLEFTIPAEASTGSFVELAERRGDFAIASAGVAIEFEGQTITKATVACSGAERRPIRARELEQFLIGRPLASPSALEAGKRFAASVDPTGDFLNSAEYRKGLIGELTKRGIEAACARALSQ